jgi:hypothetical protein
MTSSPPPLAASRPVDVLQVINFPPLHLTGSSNSTKLQSLGPHPCLSIRKLFPSLFFFFLASGRVIVRQQMFHNRGFHSLEFLSIQYRWQPDRTCQAALFDLTRPSHCRALGSRSMGGPGCLAANHKSLTVKKSP